MYAVPDAWSNATLPVPLTPSRAVLIVDADGDALRGALSAFLSTENLSVRVVENGDALLATLESEPAHAFVVEAEIADGECRAIVAELVYGGVEAALVLISDDPAARWIARTYRVPLVSRPDQMPLLRRVLAVEDEWFE